MIHTYFTYGKFAVNLIKIGFHPLKFSNIYFKLHHRISGTTAIKKKKLVNLKKMKSTLSIIETAVHLKKKAP